MLIYEFLFDFKIVNEYFSGICDMIDTKLYDWY